MNDIRDVASLPVMTITTGDFLELGERKHRLSITSHRSYRHHSYTSSSRSKRRSQKMEERRIEETIPANHRSGGRAI